MNEEHTRKWYRSEFLIPELSNREFFETWERGHTELQQKAKEKALQIIDTHESPVPQEVRDEIDDYLAFVRKRDVDKDATVTA
jgi:trimethylamine:corrinoid methyltransferase-like protein